MSAATEPDSVRVWDTYEGFVTWYSERVLPVAWIGLCGLGITSHAFIEDEGLADRVFQASGHGALLFLAAWMLLTGTGLLWGVPVSYIRDKAPRNLPAVLWLALLLTTGLTFAAMGFVLARGNWHRLLHVLQTG